MIHFAAIKAVGESMQVPLHYYRNNIIGAINLLEVKGIYYTTIAFHHLRNPIVSPLHLQVMKAAGCFQLVFSSSCTVYGEPTELPITEKHETGNITNVYGRTKYFIEEMLKDISRAEKVRIYICIYIEYIDFEKFSINVGDTFDPRDTSRYIAGDLCCKF